MPLVFAIGGGGTDAPALVPLWVAAASVPVILFAIWFFVDRRR